MVVALGIIAVLLLVVIIFQIAKIMEYISVLRGEKEITESNNRVNGFLLLSFMVVGLLVIVWSARKYSPYYLPPSSAEHGVWIDQLFDITLIVTGIVFVITQVLLFYYSFRYTKQRGTKAFFFADHHKLELTWTIIPAIVMTILVGMGAYRWFQITGPAPEHAFEVEVTGRQFSWIVRYPGPDGKFGERDFRRISSTNILGIVEEDTAAKDDIVITGSEFRIPVNRPVLVRIRSRDVLHSFYLPHFRVKMDAVPGIPTQFWFTPTVTTAQMRQQLNNPDFNYELACAELCGVGHSSMKMFLVVEEENKVNEWLAQQQSWLPPSTQTAERIE